MGSKKTYVKIMFDPVLGSFLKRLNRFMTLVEINHETKLAHLANSGRLSTVLSSGAIVYLRKQPVHPRRKSGFDLFAVQRSGITTIVDAQFSNFLAKTAFERNLFDPLEGYHVTKENFRVDGTRLDLMLQKNSCKCFVEVKSVTHVVNGVALFPDAPTIRGRKHIQYLSKLSEQRFDTAVLFSVQRSDAEILKPNSEVDPRFVKLLREARGKNVKILSLNSVFKPPDLIELKSNVPAFTF